MNVTVVEREIGLATTPPASGLPYPLRTLAVEDARLSYLDEGRVQPALGPASRSTPTLLLVHGSPTWSYLFRHAIHRLRGRTRVVAVDLPGFGHGSAPLAPGRAFSQGARLLGGFISRLDLRDVVVVAHATAGPMVMGALADMPGRVRAVVITNSFAWSLLGAPGKLGRIAKLVSSRLFGWLGVRTGLLGWITAHFSRRVGPYSASEREAISAPLRKRSVRRHLANVLRSLRQDDDYLRSLPERLRAHLSHLPALLLYGAHDNGYRAGFLRTWQDLMPRHRVTLLERSGHFPPEDEPEAYTEALESFVLAPEGGDACAL